MLGTDWYKKSTRNLDSSWKSFIATEKSKRYFNELHKFVSDEIASGKSVYPESENVFKSFELTPLKNIKVIIIGQDPYHGEGQAHGLSFSVRQGVKIPPSLRNIFKEIAAEYGDFEPSSGDLSGWAKQGVLLLNTVLTVEASKAASHQKKGWEEFTRKVVELVDKEASNCVFMLWGSFSQKYKPFINEKKHLVLESAHPSPLSAYRGFLGNDHFKKANQFLEAHNRKPINWRTPKDV